MSKVVANINFEEMVDAGCELWDSAEAVVDAGVSNFW